MLNKLAKCSSTFALLTVLLTQSYFTSQNPLFTFDSLSTDCTSNTAFTRSDPDDSTKKCIAFSNRTEKGDAFCGKFLSGSGNFELCFDHFGKKLVADEDSGGFIGLREVSTKKITWFAGASRLNEIDSQLFYYLQDTNSWNSYCLQKALKSNTQYELVLQDSQNAGKQVKDTFFRNIVVNDLDEIDTTEFESFFTSNNFINQITLNFVIQNENELLFQLEFPNYKTTNSISKMQSELFLLTGSSSKKSFIQSFNPLQTQIDDNILYEQVIEMEEFKFNEDSLEGYPCNITNNIKICKGALYFCHQDDISSDQRFVTFQSCSQKSIITYNFELRVNLSSNSTQNKETQIQKLQEITKIPCSTSDCNALIGNAELADISYTFSMCDSDSEECEKPKKKQLLWGQYARFEFTSNPAIIFKVYKAFIYLPNSDGETGIGEELNLDDIVTTHRKYGLLKVKYQVSSQASTVGTSVNLKFLVKQKDNSTRRALVEDEDNDDDYQGISVIDVSDVQVLNQNQTLNQIAEDEDFEIVWWFYLMIGVFAILIPVVFYIYKQYVKKLNFSEIQNTVPNDENQNQPQLNQNLIQPNSNQM